VGDSDRQIEGRERGKRYRRKKRRECRMKRKRRRRKKKEYLKQEICTSVLSTLYSV
jgi:hypothetical protein